MASTIKVDEIEGSTGSTVTVPTGQTFTVTDGIAIGSLPTITAVKGGTGQTGFAAGDILYANSTTTLTKLVKGSDDDVLTLASGIPSWAASAGGGKIGQVVQTVNTATESIASMTFTTVPNFSVAITPVATSSKVLVTAYMMIGSPNTTEMSHLQLFRDSTQIFMGDDAVSLRTTGANYNTPTNSRTQWQFSPCYLDSPSTTSEVAYTFKWRGEGASEFFLNRTHSNNNVGGSDGVSSYDSRWASSITVMEVLA